jgi:hypothetical protein
MDFIAWIKKGIEAFKNLDVLFTYMEVFIKKHWKMLILILLGLFIWWAMTLPPVEQPLDEPTDEQYNDTTYYEE